MTPTVQDIVNRARATAQAQQRQRLASTTECADLLLGLSDMLRTERARRGLTRHEAARKAGVTVSAWDAAEYGTRAGTVKTLVPLLRWLGEA